MLFRLKDSNTLRRVFRNTRLAFLISGLVAIAVVIVGLGLDRANTAAHRRELTIRTENEVSLIRARMIAQINMDITVVRDLANMVAVNSSVNAEEMERQINWLLIQNPHFLNIAVAPDFIVGAVYPPQAGKGRIGKDVREILAPRQLVMRTTGDQQARFYGPIAAGDGAEAFAIFFPVFVKENGQRRVWGAVEVTIDADMFYQNTGLQPARNSENQEKYPHLDHLSIAVRDLSKADSATPFFGARDLPEQQSITRKVAFAGGRWQIAAVPKAGWNAIPENQSALRLIIAAAAFLTIIPVFFATLLFGERNRNIVQLRAREATLVKLSQRLNLALESSNIGIWELHEHGHTLYWDARAAALHGKPAEDGSHSLEDWLATIVAEDRHIAEVHFFNYHVAGSAYETQYRVAAEGDTVRHLRSIGSFYTDAAGDEKTIGIVWDVTADAEAAEVLRKAKDVSDVKNAELEMALDKLSRREAELSELSGKLDLALDSYQCGIWEATIGDEGSMWDERMHELYGLTPRAGFMTEPVWLSCILPEDRTLALESARHFKQLGDTHTLICRVPTKDGSIRYVRSTGKVHQTPSGHQKIIGVAFDVTEDALMTAQLKAAKDEAIAKNIELELAKNRIEHNSLHDPLTALANRRKLDMALERLTLDGRNERRKFAILHIDLDRFKEINDTLGHAAGDAMLIHASRVLSRNLRGDDLVARIGGDEFVILAQNASDVDMSALAGRIIEQMRQPIDFEGFACRCGVSIGIAVANGVHVDARKVLINADIALYRAKSQGRNRYEFFNHNLQADIINNKRLADEILAGIENGEFTAWYQPQFSARTMQLIGVEALVRWQHSSRGLLTPDKFLKIADEINVVQTLDRIVLDTALKDKMRWAARGISVPKISVNVSARRLHDETLAESLRGLQIRPGELSFELVESIFLDESEDVAAHNLDRIKALGIDIEIDDFGTGHTSIVSLLKLKPKRLKIDRQLVQPAMNSPQERALVSSIIDIARSLGVETVAEGVETAAHAALLNELGCDLLQGYAFSPPLSFEDFAQMAEGSSWRIAS
ncbi:bifunctional diguanylate cyclase/phosphodiesterase [Rhizobium mesoamericanum]|uniref:Diguanylate cyclase/phosphodiesterase with PAS/PAC sensor(S) n=1 Tax=Rhizobium mesoamericanum STM3625 TaxID=1211777 RepID=K0PUB0_9HYPH|nr:EAL domain-containing protein [Rhizobium mesoamericanum]CCM74672.1 Diguanylate cyclase/phosphodiesterase with PAS/PAC sensor(S) [Rhizobium mesoamericanum STM3625]